MTDKQQDWIIKGMILLTIAALAFAVYNISLMSMKPHIPYTEDCQDWIEYCEAQDEYCYWDYLKYTGDKYCQDSCTAKVINYCNNTQNNLCIERCMPDCISESKIAQQLGYRQYDCDQTKCYALCMAGGSP
jgi:hypothetical protein